MTFSKRIYTLFAVFTFCTFIANAQDKPIGYWESLLPYNSAIGVATDGGGQVFSICNQAFFAYSPATGDLVTFGKETGMSDIGMQCSAYDASTKTLVLVYSNGNIDLFKDHTFYNIADLKVKSIAGNKTVYQVYTDNGIAYLSTSLGILVIDLTSHNITENYQFIVDNQTLSVSSFTRVSNYFYAATQNGLYRADKGNPELQNFAVWQRVDSVDSFISIASINNTLFLSTQKSVFTLVNDTVKTLYTCAIMPDTGVGHHDTLIQHIDAGNGKLLISEFRPFDFNGDIKIMDTNFIIVDTIAGIGNPVQAVQLSDNTVWIADAYYGLEKRTGINKVEKHNPPGPSDPNSFDLYINNKDLWVAHGGYDDLYLDANVRNGVSNLNNGKWTNYLRYVYAPFDTLADFVSVLKDETNGTLYFGSYENGLFILNKDGSYQLLNENSIFDPSYHYDYPAYREITGLALDHEGNLWVAAAAKGAQLYVKSAGDGTWSKYKLPAPVVGGQVIIDDNDQVWFTSDLKTQGLTVFMVDRTATSTGYAFSNPRNYHLTTGVGTGNLPSNTVYCIAKDKNNQIWMGTDNGIGIISGCTAGSPPCDAEIPIVQYDQFAGYLFAGNNVRTIAVDGANRKWVGTDEGVWLLSSDAGKIIYRFTQDNSPLPSNNIQKIAIDNVTGDVYIGTAQGLVSFRSTATDGGTSNQNVLAFPNPVKSGYTGTIAIKGLVDNADVRITDIDGELVYRTKALGGQAVWSGNDYTGHRPQSGVYLVFVTSGDGSQTYTGKIVFMK